MSWFLLDKIASNRINKSIDSKNLNRERISPPQNLAGPGVIFILMAILSVSSYWICNFSKKNQVAGIFVDYNQKSNFLDKTFPLLSLLLSSWELVVVCNLSWKKRRTQLQQLYSEASNDFHLRRYKLFLLILQTYNLKKLSPKLRLVKIVI